MTRDIEIGAIKCTLEPPSSAGIRESVLDAGPRNAILATAAALGLSWRGDGAPKSSFWRYDGNVMQYGAAVFDELVERGIREAHIRAAGAVAWNQIAELRVVEADVEAAADFSEGEEG